MDFTKMTYKEKDDYLEKKVFENIKERANGTLYISTYYLRQVAKMLGGNYDDLTEIQKRVLKNDIIFEKVYADNDISKYLRH